MNLPHWRVFAAVGLGGVVFMFVTLLNQLQSDAAAWTRISDFSEISSLDKTALLVKLLNQFTHWKDEDVSYRNPSETALLQILGVIVQNANYSYHPDRFQDLDLAEFTRQTVILKEIWNIYATLPPPEFDTATTRTDRIALRDAIDRLQNILYPWMTTHKPDEPGLNSLFDLVDTFQHEAGIVIATGKNGFRWTMHQISTLRNVLHCDLPIEMYHPPGGSLISRFYGGDDDLPIEYRRAIEMVAKNSSSGGTIRTVDIRSYFPDPDGLLDMPGGWAVRPFAVLASSFKKVVLSDADTVFLQDPALILKEPGFIRTGALFYHDRMLAAARKEVYDWVDNILEEVNAKHMDDVRKNSGWFDRKTFYEMERHVFLLSVINLSVGL